jgi:methyl-accepting chemotaxis protein
VASVSDATEAMAAVRESSHAVSAAIRELGEKSEEIGGIVETITGIAGQTNLLALNAAIEAARAGEQGRGFAVVADEVRKLAEESQHAAATIGGLVAEIQSETTKVVGIVDDGSRRTDEGSNTVDTARTAFVQIGEAVEGMHQRVDEIADAIKQIAESSARMSEEVGEVASVAEQSSASAEQVAASTQQTGASTQQIAASAQELAATAETLEKLVAEFKLSV